MKYLFNRKPKQLILANFQSPTLKQNDITDDGIVKEGLLFYEGSHKCNKGNHWTVSPEQLTEIAENTNREIGKKGALGVFLNHQETPENHVGYVGGHIECRPIDKIDIEKKPELKSLEGQYGLFCDRIQIKDPNMVEKLKHGLAKTISCTIDFGANVMKSLSVVGTPALPYAAMFSEDSSSVTYSEALKISQHRKTEKEELIKKFELLCNVLSNIRDMDESYLQNRSKEEMYSYALSEFGEDILNELGCNEQTESMAFNPAHQSQMASTGMGAKGFSMDEVERSLFHRF